MSSLILSPIGLSLKSPVLHGHCFYGVRGEMLARIAFDSNKVFAQKRVLREDVETG